jgi:hypothetical protein
MKIIDVFICKLRKKLASASGGKNYIETIWASGVFLASMRSCFVYNVAYRSTRVATNRLSRRRLRFAALWTVWPEVPGPFRRAQPAQ